MRRHVSWRVSNRLFDRFKHDGTILAFLCVYTHGALLSWETNIRIFDHPQSMFQQPTFHLREAGLGAKPGCPVLVSGVGCGPRGSLSLRLALLISGLARLSSAGTKGFQGNCCCSLKPAVFFPIWCVCCSGTPQKIAGCLLVWLFDSQNALSKKETSCSSLQSFGE